MKRLYYAWRGGSGIAWPHPWTSRELKGSLPLAARLEPYSRTFECATDSRYGPKALPARAQGIRFRYFMYLIQDSARPRKASELHIQLHTFTTVSINLFVVVSVRDRAPAGAGPDDRGLGRQQLSELCRASRSTSFPGVRHRAGNPAYSKRRSILGPPRAPFASVHGCSAVLPVNYPNVATRAAVF